MSEDLYLLVSFLLLSNTGSSAEDTVYVETGASVQLDIQREKLPANFDDISWKNKKSDNVVKYINVPKEVRPHVSYKNRVDFNTETFSLTLKNLQKTDSGIYRAIASGVLDTVLAEHKVSVIDAVEAPVLSVDWSSIDRCTVNVTCRGHDLRLTSTLLYGSCSHEEVTSHGIYTLGLICSEETIICNHSNHVSWKTDRRDIQQLCEWNNISVQVTPITVIVFLIVGVAGVIVFCGLALYCCCRNIKGVQKDDNVDYDDVETLAEKEMSEKTWTTVIYQTTG